MNHMITKQELIERKACVAGFDRFVDQTNDTDESVKVLSLINGKNTVSDLVWLASEKLDKKKIVRFACDCALLNIELIKPYCSDFDYCLILGFLKSGVSCDDDATNEAINSASAAATKSEDTPAIYAAWAAEAAHGVSYAAVYVSDGAATYAAKILGSHTKINELLIKLWS